MLKIFAVTCVFLVLCGVALVLVAANVAPKPEPMPTDNPSAVVSPSFDRGFFDSTMRNIRSSEANHGSK